MPFDLARRGNKRRVHQTMYAIIFFIALQLIVFLLYIKPIRALWLPSPITNLKIVAQTQFDGYPYYFDYIFYLLLVLTPCWVIALYSLYKHLVKKTKKI